jgi:hypothetical protein
LDSSPAQVAALFDDDIAEIKPPEKRQREAENRAEHSTPYPMATPRDGADQTADNDAGATDEERAQSGIE